MCLKFEVNLKCSYHLQAFDMLLLHSKWLIQQIFIGYLLCVRHCKVNPKVNSTLSLSSKSSHSGLKDRHLNRAL